MIIIPANTLSTGAYEVANSCRFNIADSTQLTKAVSSSATTKYTLSLWVKRGLISTSAANRFFVSTGGSGLGDTYFRFNPNDTLEFSGHGSSATTGGYVITNRVFRDPTSWMHIVIRYDSTQGTANDRFRLYINGVDERGVGGYSTSTMPNQNVTDNVTANGNTIRIGATASAQYFDGYMAEIHFSEGYSYAPTEFGEYNEDSPTIWQPKEADISYGTSGFYLDFEDSSNLGNDANGGTDFTEVNLAAADQATDTCTNNFCTANPLDQYGSYTLSEGNCKISSGHTSWYTIGSTMAVQNGKWYWETEFDSGTMIEIFVGVHDTSVNRTDTNSWLTGSSLFYNDAGGEIRTDGTNSTADYGTLSAGDILGIALNMDDKQITLYKNGSAIASNVALSSSISEAMPTFLTDANDVIFKVNFGGCSAFDVSSGNADDNGYGNFEYDVPTGYYALCTKNLAEFG